MFILRSRKEYLKSKADLSMGGGASVGGGGARTEWTTGKMDNRREYSFREDRTDKTQSGQEAEE